MYEVAFSVEKCNEQLLRYMYDELSACVAKIGGVCKYLQESRRSRFAIACNKLYAAAIKSQSEECLLNALTLGYKNKYIRNALAVSHSGLLVDTLINTMCIFDAKYDRYLIKKTLDISGEVCIDGYYNFRMKKLKQKWDELVEVVKNNNALLADDALIKEFLCYLMDFLPNTDGNLSVVVDGNNAGLFDDKGKIVPSIKLVRPATLEETIAINAICAKPKGIKLYCNSKQLDAAFVDLITYLFDVKLVENS
ncbi:MAG: hypothetical protein IKC47_00135 [Clostridia bacterium]|nr:hypothetical protein [Clostridia bacterium]